MASGGTPEIITWYDHNAPERTNVWFFNGGVTLAGVGTLQNVADGTYEHPFAKPEFNQGTVTGISDYTAANGYAQAYLYFTQGTYNANNGLGFPIEILSNLSLWGRMGANKGFAEPATGANRALFLGGMQLDSSTSVNNIRVQNNTAKDFTTGILLDGATNVGINDSEIGVDGPTGSYVTGVTMKDSTDLTISGSDIYGYNAPTPPIPGASGPGVNDAVGLEVVNGGNITAIKGSLIQGHSVDGDGIGLYVAPYDSNQDGILDSATVGNISGDKTATFSGISDNSDGYGLYARSDASALSSTATTTIGDIADSTFSGTGNYIGAGLWAWSDASAPSSTATTQIGNITDSTFTGTGNNFGVGLWAWSDASSTATTQIGNITDSTFTGTGVWGGIGLYAATTGGVGTVSIANTTGGVISGNTFTGGSGGTSGDLWLEGSQIYALGNGVDYAAAGPSQLLTALTTGANANTFSGLGSNKICINGTCV